MTPLPTSMSPAAGSDGTRPGERAPNSAIDHGERAGTAADASGEPRPASEPMPTPAREAPGRSATGRSSANWLSYGRDFSNTRHNPVETRIGVETVASLGASR